MNTVGRVHPRLRGGERQRGGPRDGRRGSSPPARGRVARGGNSCARRGFIPACAGERPRHSTRGCCRGVHPRLRGGESVCPPSRSRQAGSSPPARGRGRQQPQWLPNGGFIPACAGERSTRMQSGSTARVHPRLRGGEQGPGRRAAGAGGSSPPARGRGAVSALARKDKGFIPACAGERPRRGQTSGWERVHPRLRGGEASGSTTNSGGAGSSPPARGRGEHPDFAPQYPGFIPACAGESRFLNIGIEPHGVHPRLRGGEVRFGGAGKSAMGSSPPARGRVDPAECSVHGGGFIPACAGERPAARC